MKWIFCEMKDGGYAAMLASRPVTGVSKVIDLFEADNTDQVRAHLGEKAAAELASEIEFLSHKGGNELWKHAGRLAVKLPVLMRRGNAPVYPVPDDYTGD